MTTVQLSDQNFITAIKDAELVLVDFYADWCGPCKLAEPILENLAQDYQNKAKIAKVNVDQYPQIASKYQVMSIPTTILFKDGKEVARQVGFSGRKPFEDLIKKGLSSFEN